MTAFRIVLSFISFITWIPAGACQYDTDCANQNACHKPIAKSYGECTRPSPRLAVSENRDPYTPDEPPAAWQFLQVLSSFSAKARDHPFSQR